jgi:secreted PhoX family phosphatase
MQVATDGQPAPIKHNDAVHVVEGEGPQRGMAKMFMSGLPGGEICRSVFTPDNRTLFFGYSASWGRERGTVH